MEYRTRSFWLDSLVDDPLTPRPSLPGDVDVDVAIVGAGFTGLWTAYYLQQRDPGLRIAVVEAEIAGFGASGRNGGWCSGLLAMGLEAMAKESSRDAAVAMQREIFATVDEVGLIADKEGIDCHFAKGGYTKLATSPIQLERIKQAVAEEHAWGFTDDDYRLLDRDETRARIAADGVIGSMHTPHCAAIHPARLARGLATVVERNGAHIYERTPATAIEPGAVRTEHGTVRAAHVVRATEGYTPKLDGEKRTVAPIYSLMIATEPLPASFWEQVGWAARDTFNDGRLLIIYGQRTADDRIAFGGRGAPYHFGSRINSSFDRDSGTHTKLERTLKQLFPGMADARITHAWGGPLGIPRDWFSSVGLDRATGLAWAGGYVGDGVSTTNLAGRTLADLIVGADSDLVRLPWVNHRSRKWEPEPFRWIGINGLLQLPRSADAFEVRTGRPARRRSWLMNKVLGH